MATKKKTKSKASKAAPKAPAVEASSKAPDGATGPEASSPTADTLPAPEGLTRATVAEAVYLEAVEGGAHPRDARRLADDVADRLRLEGDEGGESSKAALYDLREEQDYAYPNGKMKVRKHGRTPVRREAGDIDTIVVHQTACEFGVSSRAIKASGGDIELARARRALDVACHAMAFRQGYFVAAHPLLVHVNHAGRFNDRSLGLEIDGRYPGLVDDPSTTAREDLRSTWGGEPTELTDQTLAAAAAALEWLVVEGRRAGCPITRVVAHRQSSDNRRSDPGEEIWRRLVLDFARDELGLEVVRESPWNQGRPIPRAWDPDGIGEY